MAKYGGMYVICEECFENAQGTKTEPEQEENKEPKPSLVGKNEKKSSQKMLQERYKADDPLSDRGSISSRNPQGSATTMSYTQERKPHSPLLQQ